jgi:hypothetical protein
LCIRYTREVGSSPRAESEIDEIITVHRSAHDQRL